jgi:RNA-binding protein
MQPLGKVVNVTRRGQALVRGTGKPRLGARVTDGRGRDVGRVQDLIGPVREPYVIVAPHRGLDPKQVMGHELYLAPPQEQHRGPARSRK